MGLNDYYIVFRCGTCEKGFIGKTKDNTPGFRISTEYICKYCSVNSTKGELVAEEYDSDWMPREYSEHMTVATEPEERETWSRIWWDKN